MNRKVRKGFSIFEAITAVVILSIAMGALLSGIKMAAGAIRHCELKNDAMFLAGQLAAERRLVGREAYEVLEGESSGFNWKVGSYPSEAENLAQVKAEVFWLERGVEKSYELITFMAMKSFEQEF